MLAFKKMGRFHVAPLSSESSVALRAVLLLLLTGFSCACHRGLDQAEFQEVPRATTEEVVRVGGSDSVLPLLKRVAQEFERSELGVDIDFAVPVSSRGGVTGTAEGDYDLGVVSREFREDEKALGLQYLHLAQEGVSFATHPGVGVAQVTSQQILDIYAGKIKDWAEVGGRPGPVVVLDRPEHSSPKRVLRKMLFGPAFRIRPDAVVLQRPAEMDEAIASVAGAIGFTALSSLITTGKRVTVLNLDGIAPTPVNVSKGIYPLWRPIGLVTPRQPSRPAMRFLDFVFGATGRQILLAFGYAPVRANLVVALLPGREALIEGRRYGLMQQYLSRRLGSLVGIEFRQLGAYDDIIDDLVRREVNAAFLDGYPFLVARSRIPLEPLVRPQREGVSTYRALIIIRKGAGIATWRDLKGKRLGIVPFTTAGELFPRSFFQRHGVGEFHSFFGEVVRVGSHEAAVVGVLRGRLDAAGVKDSVYRRIVASRPEAAEGLGVLAASEPLPEETLVVRRDLKSVCFNCHREDKRPAPPVVANALGKVAKLPRLLRDIFLQLGGKEQGRRVLREFGADEFVPASEQDFLPVCRIAGAPAKDLDGCIRWLVDQQQKVSGGKS